jgi:DNA repair exonuclease SbcCD ATPase subunit
VDQIKQKALELCWKIEALPASEQQTEISVMASELKSEVERLQEVNEQLSQGLQNLNIINKQLQAENEALKYELTKLQWQPTKPGPDRQYCCPVCGGSKEFSGHDTACELAALIDPYKAETYKEMTGGDIIKTLLFCKANGF